MPKGRCTPIFLPRGLGRTEPKGSIDLLASRGEKEKEKELMDRPETYSIYVAPFMVSGLILLRRRNLTMLRKTYQFYEGAEMWGS